MVSDICTLRSGGCYTIVYVDGRKIEARYRDNWSNGEMEFITVPEGENPVGYTVIVTREEVKKIIHAK